MIFFYLFFFVGLSSRFCPTVTANTHQASTANQALDALSTKIKLNNARRSQLVFIVNILLHYFVCDCALYVGWSVTMGVAPISDPIIWEQSTIVKTKGSRRARTGPGVKSPCNWNCNYCQIMCTLNRGTGRIKWISPNIAIIFTKYAMRLEY